LRSRPSLNKKKKGEKRKRYRKKRRGKSTDGTKAGDGRAWLTEKKKGFRQRRFPGGQRGILEKERGSDHRVGADPKGGLKARQREM